MGDQPDFCLGPGPETIDQEHTDPGPLAYHLTAFLGHRSPKALIESCGSAAVNQALQELILLSEEIKSPAGWLTWRSTQIVDGSPPIPPPIAVRLTLREARSRAAHQRDILRRFGPNG